MAEEPVSVATLLAATTALSGGYAVLGFLLGRALPMRRSVTGLHGLGAAAVLGLLGSRAAGGMAMVGAGPTLPGRTRLPGRRHGRRNWQA